MEAGKAAVQDKNHGSLHSNKYSMITDVQIIVNDTCIHGIK